MPKINVLPKSVSELIAAGEVVERPSSVVKELIENSIDAGASSIGVEIKNGGIKYIRVTDDGCGIHREDVPTAFMSHGTSKIKTGDDLDSILTLGFRGEALPSAAAVSRLSMLTKAIDEEVGTSFDIEGGEVVSTDDAGCPDGTTIIIRDLFYNTPARMKFLKRDMTEGTYVSDIVTKTAISHPEIRFSLIKDGKPAFSTPGNGNLASAIYSALGKQISEGLIECEEYEHKSIKVRGFISKPLCNRPNRNLQYCYVNGRFVRIPAAAAALDEAYKNRIMVGKFPMCFLFLDIPPEKIDVNVHPAKTEIRFSEDSAIFEAIYYAAKSALNKGDNERPGVVLQQKQKNVLAKKLPETSQMSFSSPAPEVKTPTRAEIIRPFSDPQSVPVHRVFSEPEKKEQNVFSSPAENLSEPSVAVFRDTSAPLDNLNKGEFNSEAGKITVPEINTEPKKKCNIDIFVDDTPEEETSSKYFGAAGNTGSKFDFEKAVPEEPVKKDVPPFRIVGEAFKTYIIVELENKLYIIDKHAAHERMIFNRLSQRGMPEDSQLLLSPVTVVLSGREYAVVLDNLEVFSKGGFLVEDFGRNTVIVRECPVILEKEDISQIITEIAGELLRGNLKPVPEKLQWLYHSTSCRAAIKAGDSLKKEETEAFVYNLLKDDSVFYCPHGRPVLYELSRHELEKQFGRV